MNHRLLYQWTEEVATHLEGLNSYQVENIALFSQGVVMAESSRQGQIARKVAAGERVSSTVKRFQRFLGNESLRIEQFFGAWVRWVLGVFDEEHITLLVDETKLGDRLAMMMVGVAWEGRCIPLVWRCYRANDAASYPPEGQVRMIEGLLKLIHAALPRDKPVLVLADRGIGTSPDLCRAVAALGWQYLFRITKQSKIVTDQGEFTIAAMAQPGQVWVASGHVFKQRGHLPASALARWDDGYAQPWALVTNALTRDGGEYAQRAWQEQSFRDLKSGGWHWGQSRVRCPDRMARLLILLVLAYAWMLALGCYAVHLNRAQPLHRRPDGSSRRQWSLFKEGLQLFTDVVQRQTVCLKLCFVPDKRFT